MTDGTRVPIAKAKGRPMLQWVGKRPLREVRSFPAQLVERFASTTPLLDHRETGQIHAADRRSDHRHAR